jgi:hypothetical protein
MPHPLRWLKEKLLALRRWLKEKLLAPGKWLKEISGKEITVLESACSDEPLEPV